MGPGVNEGPGLTSRMACVRAEGHWVTQGLGASDGESPLQAEWSGLVLATNTDFQERMEQKEMVFQGDKLEAMYQRHQVEDRGPRDRKVSQDTDAADQERGEKTMGLFQPWGMSGTRLWTTVFQGP